MKEKTKSEYLCERTSLGNGTVDAVLFVGVDAESIGVDALVVGRRRVAVTVHPRSHDAEDDDSDTRASDSTSWRGGRGERAGLGGAAKSSCSATSAPIVVEHRQTSRRW